MKYRVRANEGFVSDQMDLLSAIRYSYRLEVLGNYDVEVIREDGVKIPGTKVRRKENRG